MEAPSFPISDLLALCCVPRGSAAKVDDTKFRDELIPPLTAAGSRSTVLGPMCLSRCNGEKVESRRASLPLQAGLSAFLHARSPYGVMELHE